MIQQNNNFIKIKIDPFSFLVQMTYITDVALVEMTYTTDVALYTLSDILVALSFNQTKILIRTL